ncbi:MAG: DNA/RNA non-specific endonuclease [Planctomycetaceae bacterium]|nr:DNA/RNA non-specific endonuclease [Planctomycetaceae bacterium]
MKTAYSLRFCFGGLVASILMLSGTGQTAYAQVAVPHMPVRDRPNPQSTGLANAPDEATTAEVDRHLRLGRPILLHDRERQGYAVAVDGRTRIPLWVQYELRRSELDGPGSRDDSEFEADDSLPLNARAELSDYRHSGFDRGHMAPAGDMKRSQDVMDDSFLLSNIAPQVGSGFNRHIWRLLEEAVRDWVREREQLTIITGPVFAPDGDNTVSYKVVGEHNVAVPTHFFKIVVDNRGDERDSLAFLMPNRVLFGRQFEDFLVSIDEIEKATGLDFLSNLPDDAEEKLESAKAHRAWRTGRELRTLMARAAREVQVHEIALNENGRFVNAEQVEQLVQAAKEANPTHFFLLAHGWNNSRSDALNSYQRMISLMGQVADARPGTRPEPYRPFVVGVVWPSKAWDTESRSLTAIQAGEDLTLAVAKVLPPGRSEAYLDDVTRLRTLLLQDPVTLTPQDYQDTWQILRRYSLPAESVDDECLFDGPLPAGTSPQKGLGGLSIRDLFRVFTFWQMKKRAGTVGNLGGHQLLARLMQEFRDAEWHVSGHSFGCRLWLAALTNNELPRKIDSLTLIQGAVSSYAFAISVPGENRPGGYRPAINTVNGPIIVTHSKQDMPLNWAYPLGSRLAGQVGELEPTGAPPSPYSALGAVGASAVGHRLVLEEYRQDPTALPPRYALGSGVFSVNGDELIDGHSGFYSEHIAWLLWATIEQ